MKVVTINGNYSYKDDNHFEGLICLVQFESADTEIEIDAACKSLKNIAGKNNLVLVPFSHLSNNVKEFAEADRYFTILNSKCKSVFGDAKVYSAPFGSPKKFNIETPEHAQIKFLRFEPKTKNAIKSLYSDNADVYEKHMHETGHYAAQSKLIAHFTDVIKEPLIDLGCGTGFLLGEISKLDNINEVYANDFAENMILKARENLKDHIVFYSSFDAENIKLHTRFMTIVCCNLFFYLSNRSDAINNWKNILQEGGVIIVMEEYPFLFPINENLNDFTNKLTQVHNYCKPTEIINIFVDNGFSLLKEFEEKIDSRHNLHGYVFGVKSEQ